MASKKSPGNRRARSKMRQRGDEEMGRIARARSLSKALLDWLREIGSGAA